MAAFNITFLWSLSSWKGKNLSTIGRILLFELGIAVLKDDGTLVNSLIFDDPAEDYHSLSKGNNEVILNILPNITQFDHVKLNHPFLLTALRQTRLNMELIPQSEQDVITKEKVGLLARYRICTNREQAIKSLQKFATDYSSIKVKETSESLDLHVIQAINALDEVDEIINTLGTRVREWYGLHFPELDILLQNINTYANIVKMAGSREHIDKSTISDSELHDNKIQLITDLAKKSRGGDISPEVLSILRSLAAGVLSLASIRASLSESIENLMKTIAPNLNEILTSVIAARLMARAGSLRRLALLPASTIQILGAEKALFRALKTGARPPKHGVLFQHPAVHSASKWQRGKIARTLASKIAIAARVDFYRHSLLEEDFFANLKKRIEEIQKSNPKRVSHGEMLDHRTDTHRKEFDSRKGNRRMKWSKGRGRHEKRSIRFGRKR